MMESEILIKKYCFLNNLETYDPYDIWKTKLGLQIKKWYNLNKYIALVPAGILTVFDLFLNNRTRCFYIKTDQPIVRAYIVLIIINLYKSKADEIYLVTIKDHLKWLAKNKSESIENYGWGINFKHVVSPKVKYSSDEPFSTITPYILEAFVEYRKLTGDISFDYVIEGIYRFFTTDIKTLDESEEYLITSYASFRDRIAINAVSYTMYALAIFLEIYPERKTLLQKKIQKMYNYIRSQQNQNGSWMYSPEGSSFIDCFHSVFVLKNIIKTNKIYLLNGCNTVVDKGIQYLENYMCNAETGLFKRFSKSNKPSIVRYDLYDNAEMLNLYLLLAKKEKSNKLNINIKETFIKNRSIYSVIDLFGFRKNKDMLRWAVMPYLYALSKMLQNED